MISAMGTGIGDEFDLDAGALPQDHHHDRRRRRRLAHPHAHPHLPLPPDAAAGRGRLRLHRPAAALPAQAGQPGDATSTRKPSSKRSCCAAASSRSRSTTPTPASASPRPSYQRFLKLFSEYEGWVKKLKSQFGGELVDWLKNGPIDREPTCPTSPPWSKRCAPTSTSATSSTWWAPTTRPRSSTRGSWSGKTRPGPQPADAVRGSRGARVPRPSGACTSGSEEMVGQPPFTLHLGNARPRRRATKTCACRSSSWSRRASSCSASRVSAR